MRRMRLTEDEALVRARKLMNAERPDEVSVRYGKGHSGVGWYGFYTEYPTEGSERVDVPWASDGASALLMREVLCEQVWRSRHLWDVNHPARALGMRMIDPEEILDHVEESILGLGSDALKALAAHVLDAIIAKRIEAKRKTT
jgi:hypothetical protein